MAVDNGPGDTSVALAKVCARLDDVREVAARRGRTAELEEVLTGIRGVDDPAPQVRALHELLRRCGVHNGIDGIGRGAGIGGLPTLDGHPVEEGFVCSRSRCARVALGRDPEPERHCGLYDEPLRLRRVAR
ncbi:hypothetical protein ABZY68_22205 [Streptomyces sp. NPDC006482]|uniref:hypothetical protein n=1 Tax=Streptomyces sp. NPDC006482 TaxID=3154306 RepID=UPI0033BF512D